MTREEAINKVRWVLFGLVVDKDIRDAFEMLIPELRESEDEKIRNDIMEAVENYLPYERVEDIRAYLEKQKYDRMKPIYDARESFESALEKAWNDYHNGYENVDKLEDDYVECAHAKGFREGYLFGIEKQKEQKPTATINGEPIPIENHSVDIPLAAWSEEDEDMLNSCISSIEEAKENRYAYKETDGDTSYDHEIAWLKSLRPQPHWKPSEEQLYSLKYFIKLWGDSDKQFKYVKVFKDVESLYEQLQEFVKP